MSKPDQHGYRYALSLNDEDKALLDDMRVILKVARGDDTIAGALRFCLERTHRQFTEAARI